ncbi:MULTISPECIES: hypothetical protein [unclassified Peribacillus]|uniref:hypothetical protein n=1 Tax=unclassified Peribacillus TaxID=2675266 RepID=UPI00366FE9CD
MRKILKVLGGLVIVLSLVACGDEDRPVKSVETTASEPEQKAVEAKPKPSIDKVELNSEEVTPILKERIADVDKVEIKDGHVKVIFRADESHWDETEIASSTAHQGLTLIEMLFKNSEVKEVEIITPTTMIDSKGNEKVTEVVKVTWDRATADEINYKNFSDMLYVEFPRFYNESSSYYIHPGVFSKIKAKNLAQFETGFQKE